jgi:hypothetical protein
MSPLTRRRACWIAAGVAAVAYLLALRNGWSGDDVVAIRDNPAAHSLGAAIAAWFAPYWPGEWQWAGLYRPLTVLSYGLDWSLSGGATWWFHLVNVLLHALATGLAVLVVSRWLPPIGALVAGAIFAIHPVHVEAVANVVGRAELLVAVGILGAVLGARRFRRAGSEGARYRWLAVTLATVFLALASKEHGVIALAVLALDHALERERATRSSVPLYLGVLAATGGWLFLWRGIAGGYVGGGQHAAFFGLSWGERLTTMLPVYLEVLRTLAWPFALLSDYAPQTVSVHTALTAVGVLGLAASLSVVTLGLLSVRRAPAIAFGIFLALLSYAPTSNLVFVSGVMLAERNLYLAVLAPAVVAGWVVAGLHGRPQRRAVAIGLGALLVAFAARTIDRIPFWIDPLTPVVEEQTAHPENFHTRILLAQFVAARGDSAWALGELLVAGDLFPRDPWARVLASRHALAMGRPLLALRQAEEAFGVYQGDPRLVDALVRALLANGLTDSAVAVGSRSAAVMSGSVEVLDAYRTALSAAGDHRWGIALLDLRADWLSGRLADAQARLDSFASLVDGPGFDASCADVRGSEPIVRALRPGLLGSLESLAQCENVGPTELTR